MIQPVLITTMALGGLAAAVQETATPAIRRSYPTVRDFDQSGRLVLDTHEEVPSLDKRALGFDRFAYQAPTSTSKYQFAPVTGLTDGRFPRIDEIMKRNVDDVDMLGQDNTAHADQMLPRRFHPRPHVNITIQTTTSTSMTVTSEMWSGNDTVPSLHARKVVNLDPSHMAYWTMKLSKLEPSPISAVAPASTLNLDFEDNEAAQDQITGPGVVSSVATTSSLSSTTTAVGQAKPIFMGRTPFVPYVYIPPTYYSDADSIPVAGIAAFALAVALAGAVILL